MLPFGATITREELSRVPVESLRVVPRRWRRRVARLRGVGLGTDDGHADAELHQARRQLQAIQAGLDQAAEPRRYAGHSSAVGREAESEGLDHVQGQPRL